MSIEVFKEPLMRRYYVSSFFSLACVYMIVMTFFAIFLPLFLAYNSNGFWLKDNVIYEQPNVQYAYQAIFHFHGEKTTVTDGAVTDEEKIIFYWSTESTLNDMHNHLLRPALTSSSEVDTDRNGLMDRLDLSVQLPLATFSATSNASVQTQEVITGMDTLIFYEVRVQERAKYIFDAVTYFSHRNGGEAMGTLNIDSNVEVIQRDKLQSKGGFQSPYQDDPLMPVMYEDTSLSEVQIANILEKSASRNLTLGVHNNYIYAEAPNGAEAFTANFKIRVPPQYIIYSPGVSEVLKFAWVQFLAIFLVIFFLLDRMSSFVFTHKLLYARQVPDMVVKKMD